MKLYLVRHATALDRIGGAVRTDADRPLIEVGKKEAEVVAHAVRRLGAKGDIFMTSPLVRARQTAEIFAEVFGAKKHLHFSESLAPGVNMSAVYDDLKEIAAKAEDVFLFGHMPDMTMIASKLLGSDEELNMPFKKAGVCRIDVFDLPPTTPGELKWFITPKIAHAFR